MNDMQEICKLDDSKGVKKGKKKTLFPILDRKNDAVPDKKGREETIWLFFCAKGRFFPENLRGIIKKNYGICAYDLL